MDSKIWLIVGVIALIAVLYMLYPFVNIIVYSIFVYYIARPLYSRMLPKLKSRSISAFVSIFILALPVVVVVLYTIGAASIEMKNFMETTDIPALKSSSAIIDEVSKIAGDIKPEEILSLFTGKSDIEAKIIEFLSGGLSSLLWEVISNTLNIIFKLFLVFVISFYLIIDGEKVRMGLKNTFFPGDEVVDRFFDELDQELSSVFSGNILTAGVIAVLGSLTFTVVNLTSTVISIPYPLLFGMLCGIASLIPVAGEALVWGPLTLYLILKAAVGGVLPQSIMSIILFVIGTYLIVDWLPNMLLRPRMTGGKLHKGLLLLSYIFGPIVFGLKGLFLGPMILVFTVNFAEIILPKLAKR